MFLRTYSPAIDVETNTFTGFIFKAVDFDAGCSVTPVGRICSEVVSDPDCYDVYAVEFDAAHFLFMVDDGRTRREIGKLEHIQLVSANVWSCDNDSNRLQNISFYKPFVNLRNSAAHGHKDPAQFIRSLEFLQDGVRRLNFSFEGERAFSAMPLQFYGEFRTHDYGVERSNEIKDSDLATLLQMRNHITGFRALKAAGAGTRNPDALLLISNEERVERRIAEKEQEVLDTARLWMKNNDQMLPPKKGIGNFERCAQCIKSGKHGVGSGSGLSAPTTSKRKIYAQLFDRIEPARTVAVR